MKEMVEHTLLPQATYEQVDVELNGQERIGKWKAYAEYKASGVEWLGEIPEHWEVKRLKFLCTVNPSKAETHILSKDTVVSFLPMELIGEDGQLSLTEQREIHQVQQGYSYFRSGDVIVAKITPCFENGKGALCEQLINTIGFGTTELHTIRPGRYLHALFLFYTTRSTPFRHLGAANMIGSAGQQRVPEEFINDFPLAQPPLEEQHAIATFLNHKTTRIKDLIAKKERHIALLQEQRIALINQAVTKGLNTDVPMKDSGVEWLGQIPEHWSYRQFKHIADISYGLTLELDRTETEGTCILSLPNLTKDGQLILHDVPLTPLTPQEKTHLLLRKGDLLFNWRNGSLDHVGKTAYFNADGEYTHVSFLLRVRFDTEQYEPRYYHMFLNNLRSTGFFSASKSRINNTYNQAELKRLEVIVPPLQEQKAIAAYLEQETTKINKLITGIQESIKKLKEYSTTLISAAVTGKIDVRGEVAVKIQAVAPR